MGGGNAQLSLAHLGGVFIVLVGGMVISIVIAVFEFAWKRRKLAVDENVSLKKKFSNDINLIFSLGISDARDVGRIQICCQLESRRHKTN